MQGEDAPCLRTRRCVPCVPAWQLHEGSATKQNWLLCHVELVCATNVLRNVTTIDQCKKSECRMPQGVPCLCPNQTQLKTTIILVAVIGGKMLDADQQTTSTQLMIP
eukprot:751121-Hanusia_phi.AAC.1